MFFFKKSSKKGRAADETLEQTEGDDGRTKMGRKKTKRKVSSKKKATLEEGSRKVVKKRPTKTLEDETPNNSIQQKSIQKSMIQKSSRGAQTDRRSVEELSRPATKAAKRAQVKVFVEETLRKGVKGLIAEFKSMKRMNDFTKMTEFVAQNPQGRNRYKDVGCLDNDRVIIKIGPVSYIHANYVSSPTLQKRFICTQAPLPKTCPDFWYMVVQEKSVAILMLCNFIEQNAKKCAEYFPVEEDKPVSFEGVKVVLKKQEQFPFPFETRVRILVRTLEVTVPGQPLHTCLHYHWQDWPDRGVPEADLAPVVLLSKLKESTAPIIVHCSAGIGRTGSIVLIQHALELLHLPAPLLEISTYLTELRKQRNNSIQTEHQYLYIHQVLLLHLKKAKYLDETVTPYLETFTKDYINATKGF